MSHLTASPEVYQYGSNKPYLSFNHNHTPSSPQTYAPASNIHSLGAKKPQYYGNFGESQVSRVFKSNSQEPL